MVSSPALFKRKQQEHEEDKTPQQKQQSVVTTRSRSDSALDSKNLAEKSSDSSNPDDENRAIRSELIIRNSLLDNLSSGNSSFEGFIHLAFIFLVSACIQIVASNYFRHGFLVDFSLLSCMARDLTFVLVYQMITLPMCFLVHGAFSLWMRNKISFLPVALVLIAAQVALILGTILIIVQRRIAVIVAAFLAMTMIVNVMKLHSYASVLYEYKMSTAAAAAAASAGNNKTNNIKLSRKTSSSSSSNGSKSNSRVIKQVSVRDFGYFLMAPTLCFHFEFPRTDRVRPLYALRQLVQCLACVLMMYTITMQYLVPVLKNSPYHDTLYHLAYDLVQMSIPWFIVWLLGSYAFFHCYLNALAELTRYGDRQWYKDWWNSTSFDMFWRNWNLPVHNWLLRHVYFLSLQQLKLSKMSAVVITFVLSALMHELIMGIAFRSLKGWFFVGMAAQAPFVIMGPYVKKYKRVGNISMWLSLFTGQPFLMLLYFRDWFRVEASMFCIH